MPIAPAVALPGKGKRIGRHRDITASRRSFCFPRLMTALVCGGTSCAQQTRTTWHDYLGGPDSSHYSALKQINTSNVNKLDVAWSLSDRG